MTIYSETESATDFFYKSIIMTGHICEAQSLEQQTTTWVTWFLWHDGSYSKRRFRSVVSGLETFFSNKHYSPLICEQQRTQEYCLLIKLSKFLLSIEDEKH